MPVSAHMFCVRVVHVYIVHIHTHTETYARIAYFCVCAEKIRNIFNMHMEWNVNLAHCDTRHTFVTCGWSSLVAPKT